MKSREGLFVPLLIIAVGLGWLLNSLNVLPDVNWLWASILGGCGIALLFVFGVNQLTFVVGPFLILASILFVLSQTGKIATAVEFPVLFIAFGLFFLLS